MMPRQNGFLHMMLTGSMLRLLRGWGLLRSGAAAGIHYQLMGMFVPLAILVALRVLRPLTQLLDDDW